MFCQNCGTKLNDNAQFCYNCGSSQVIAPPAQVDTIPVDPAMPFPEKVRLTAKCLGSSPRFLIATICFTLAIVLNMVTMYLASRSLSDIIVYYTGFIQEGNNSNLDLSTPFLIACGISMLPAVLITIGLWITYGSCASRKPKVNTAGLTMIFVVNLILLVLTCLGLLIAMIPTIISAVQAENTLVTTFTLALGLLYLAIFLFVLIYNIKVCTTISNIRSTLQTGVPDKRVSRLVGLLCYIAGSLIATSGASTLFSAGFLALGNLSDGASLSATLLTLVSAVSYLLTATFMILFGSLIFSYRKKMEALEAEERLNTFKTLSYAAPYTSPVYTPPQTENE